MSVYQDGVGEDESGPDYIYLNTALGRHPAMRALSSKARVGFIALLSRSCKDGPRGVVSEYGARALFAEFRLPPDETLDELAEKRMIERKGSFVQVLYKGDLWEEPAVVEAEQ